MKYVSDVTLPWTCDSCRTENMIAISIIEVKGTKNIKCPKCLKEFVVSLRLGKPKNGG